MDAAVADARNFVVGDIAGAEVDGFRHQVDEIFLKVDKVKHCDILITSLLHLFFLLLGLFHICYLGHNIVVLAYLVSSGWVKDVPNYAVLLFAIHYLHKTDEFQGKYFCSS